MISGTSLSELLASGGNTPDTEEAKAETQAEPAAVEVDPACEQKLVRARGRDSEPAQDETAAVRPRLRADDRPGQHHFGQRPDDGAARGDSPQQDRDADAHRRAGGHLGAIELEVIVNEEIRAARPIKLEDRVKHMTEKNPLIAELRKALDLEVE